MEACYKIEAVFAVLNIRNGILEQILTKFSIRTKLGRFRAAMAWFPATWGELTPLGKATLSTVEGLFKLSTSEAEEDGDSPDRKAAKMTSNKSLMSF